MIFIETDSNGRTVQEVEVANESLLPTLPEGHEWLLTDPGPQEFPSGIDTASVIQPDSLGNKWETVVEGGQVAAVQVSASPLKSREERERLKDEKRVKLKQKHDRKQQQSTAIATILGNLQQGKAKPAEVQTALAAVVEDVFDL